MSGFDHLIIDMRRRPGETDQSWTYRAETYSTGNCPGCTVAFDPHGTTGEFHFLHEPGCPVLDTPPLLTRSPSGDVAVERERSADGGS